MADKGQDPVSLLLPVFLLRIRKTGEEDWLSGSEILSRKLLSFPAQAILPEYMPTGKKRLLEPLYSIVFLNFMAHTDRMRLAIPTPLPRKKHSGGSAPKNTPPMADPILVPSKNNQPRINRTQTVIVARALKIGGISLSFWFYITAILPIL